MLLCEGNRATDLDVGYNPVIKPSQTVVKLMLIIPMSPSVESYYSRPEWVFKWSLAHDVLSVLF